MSEMPQRRLALELRLAIDRAQLDPRAVKGVRRLVRKNPRGSTASHVTHNLGPKRRAWLARLDATEAARSLGDTMVRKHEVPIKKTDTTKKPENKGTTVRGDAVPEKKG